MSNYSRNIILCFILIILFLIPIHAQEEIFIISPNVFIRGIEKPNGVLYTATFIKPTDDMPLRNLSVEITIPADAQFTEMLVSNQVQFDVIRRNRQGELTLIWQISRVEGDTPLDSFSFTLAEPLSSELEFYMLWQNEQGQNFLENFLELPSIVTATATDANFTPTSEAFSFVGDTGIQVASPFNKPLSFHLLDNEFNPPVEYGAVWWCSLLQLDGLAEGESVMVIVPLRRPVAPFIELVLFQQQSDESWVPLEETGIVTADGQYVIYRHTGGLVATGGDEDIRHEVMPVSEVQIEDVQQVRPESPVNNNPEPPSNTVVETNNNSAPVPVVNTPVPVVNTPIPVVNTPVPVVNTPVPVVNTPIPVPSTEDGRSNTVVVGEATADNTIQDGTSNTVIIGEATADNTIQDGTSNTVIIGEATADNTIQNGTSNTVIIGEGTSAAPVVVTATEILLTSTEDGRSNTVVVGEATADNTIQDGTSNTVIIGEGTSAASVVVTATEILLTPTEDGSSNTIAIGEGTATNDNTIRDGTSNTVIIGEASPEIPVFQTATSAPIDLSTSPTPALVATALPLEATIITATASPEPILLTQTDVTDIVVPSSTTAPATMTSNPSSLTTVNGTPTVQLVTETPTPVSTIPPVIIATPPIFGSGGTRIVILTTEDGEVIQCQVGPIQCAIIKRIDASEE